MIKVHGVMAQGFSLNESVAREDKRAGDAATSSRDSVTISEEGKKRLVMGHVLASISGQGSRKPV